MEKKQLGEAAASQSAAALAAAQSGCRLAAAKVSSRPRIQ
jgi:hypothetical protein